LQRRISQLLLVTHNYAVFHVFDDLTMIDLIRSWEKKSKIKCRYIWVTACEI